MLSLMRDFLQELWQTIREPFGQACAVSIAVLIAIQAFTAESFQVRQFLHQLAEELTITLALALLVDVYLKQKLAKTVSQEVWSYASAQDLPEAIRQSYHDLLHMSFVREDFVLHVRLNPIPDHPDFLRAELKVKFELRNLSDAEHKYPLRSKIEKSDYPEVGQSRLEYVFVGGADGFSLGGEQLQQQTKETPAYFEYSRKIDVPPAIQGPVEIRTERSSVFRHTDTHTLDILYTTVGIRVIAEGPEDLVWQVQFGPGAAPEEKSAGAKREWYYPGLQLAGHAIIVRWEAKSKPH